MFKLFQLNSSSIFSKFLIENVSSVSRIPRYKSKICNTSKGSSQKETSKSKGGGRTEKQCSSVSGGGKREIKSEKTQCRSSSKPDSAQCRSSSKADKKKDKKSEKQCSGGRSDSEKKPEKQCSGGGEGEVEESSSHAGGGDLPRVAINGFGRIGRTALRVAVEHSCPLEIVAINDTMMSTEYMAYLLKYDSTHGRFIGDVEVDGNKLIVDGKPISTFQEADPKKLPWKSVGAEYIIESSGKLNSAKAAQGHIDAGAKKVVISAPAKDAPMFVIGVNLENYEPSTKIISAASCATNALAPLCKVVHENFGIEEGLMTTVHADTASQKVLDSASKKNWRESRGALQNIIPTYTGAAAAIGKVFPELEGKMTALSIRVPTPNVSLIDLTCRLKKGATMEEIECALSEAMEGPMMGIIDVTTDEVVSSDFIGSHYSSTYDSKASLALNNKFVKLIAWFDNEYGYTCRVIDLVKFMHAQQE